MTPTYEKMSKSRNNVITIDEVAHGVNSIDDNYYFVSLPPNFLKIDYRKINIYRNPVDGYYYTWKKFGHQPVLLVDRRESYIPRLIFNDKTIVQHEDKPEVQAILEE